MLGLIICRLVVAVGSAGMRALEAWATLAADIASALGGEIAVTEIEIKVSSGAVVFVRASGIEESTVGSLDGISARGREVLASITVVQEN